ncbi:hypothetical protein [Chroococcidiopsis cubana]|nr:hypothetical protein [Chroococcidiopsis cubana]
MKTEQIDLSVRLSAITHSAIAIAVFDSTVIVTTIAWMRVSPLRRSRQ